MQKPLPMLCHAAVSHAAGVDMGPMNDAVHSSRCLNGLLVQPNKTWCIHGGSCQQLPRYLERRGLYIPTQQRGETLILLPSPSRKSVQLPPQTCRSYRLIKLIKITTPPCVEAPTLTPLPVFECHDLKRMVQDRVILSGISFRLEPRTVLFVRGPSGVGKRYAARASQRRHCTPQVFLGR